MPPITDRPSPAEQTVSASLPAPAGAGQGVGTSSVLQRPGVSVLFARSDSCYFDLAGDVWDAQRDARGYVGSNPVVCHPPCRGWGRLRHWAKPRPDEKALALFAVAQVRRCGGVLEHPWGSTLWPAAGLPHPGHVDAFGGWTLLVDQGWWGHAAPKPTYLYIVGCSREQVGDLPVQLHRAAGRTLKLSPADRERTPPAFARFLVDLAAKCAGSQLQRSIAVTASCAPAAVTADQDRSNSDLAAQRRAKAAEKRAAFSRWADSAAVQRGYISLVVPFGLLLVLALVSPFLNELNERELCPAVEKSQPVLVVEQFAGSRV